MRFKYYLRGCGMGILVATLLLMVAAGSPKEDMRDEDVIARAKELGMVFSEEGENPQGNSPETKDSQTEDSETENSQTTDSQTEDSGTDNSQTTDSQTEDSQKEDSQIKDSQIKDSQTEDSQTEDSGEEGPIRISVKQGEVCRELAEDLLEKGLITDAEEFRNFMKDYGYDDMLRVGAYEFEKGMTYLEIAKILTKQ